MALGWALVAGSLFPNPVQAQAPPEYVQSPQFTDGASDVHVADLDGDGDPDLLSASINDDKIAWYENFNGTFGSQQVITTSLDGPYTVHAADLDADGDLDVVSASERDNTVVWYENLNGSRAFSGANIITDVSAFGPRDVRAADLNGDGRPDILVAFDDGDKVAWYENEGSGSFSAENILVSSSNGANDAYAADVDGDGDLDVVAASRSEDEVYWFENTDGAGTFSAQKFISTTIDAPYSVFAIDLDGDTDVDVLATGFNDDSVVWYENTDGDGTFAAAKEISTIADGAIYVRAADLDGDGDPEVIAASFNNDAVNVYDNQIGEAGADSDGFGPTFQPSTQSDRARAVNVADWDEDGDLDLFAASEGDDTVSYYENRVSDGQGFPTETLITPGAGANGARNVIGADLNGDGRADIVALSGNDDKVAWYPNDGTLWLGRQQVISTDQDFPTGVAAGDLDADGDLDLVVSSYNDDRVTWYENTDGEGAFVQVADLTTNADRAQSAELADLDGDGDLDVLVASERDDSFRWFENSDGAGTFAAGVVIWSAANGADQAIAADLDGDGDLDVVGASRFDDTIAWFENTDGDGSFSSEKVIIDTATDVVDVHAADIDGDGDPDLVYTPETNDVINWLRNDGGGSFDPPALVTNQVNNPVAVTTADINGDGLLDIIAAEEAGDSYGAFIQTTSFGVVDFSDEQLIASGINGASDVAVADINGDGRPDVLGAARFADRVSWFANTEGTTLPVELSGFTAAASETSVTLTWATASETNNAGFTVERSRDGVSFGSIGFIPGVGTTQEVQRYRFVDDALPFASTLHYRLTQVDVDGTTAVLPVVTVQVTPKSTTLQPSVPNPARASAALRYTVAQAAPVRMDVYDVLGRRVATLVDADQAAGTYTAQLDASRLAPGVYFVRLEAGPDVTTQKVTVIR